MNHSSTVVDCPIETGIAIPAVPVLRHRHTKTHRVYHFNQMAVGDSFFAEITEGESAIGLRDSLQVSIAQRKRSGKPGRFIIRNWSARGGAVGFRVWRTE